MVATDANTEGLWIFDDVYHDEVTSDTLQGDQSANNNDLTAQNFSTDFADELTGTNFLYSGGNALTFNGTSEHLDRSAASSTDFDPGTSDFTIDFFAEQTISQEGYLFAKYDGTSGWLVKGKSPSHATTIKFEARGSGAFQSYSLGYTIDDTSFVTWVVKRSTNELLNYKNGVDLGTTNISSLVGSLSNSADLEVGTWSTFEFGGILGFIRYSSVARTFKEHKEAYALVKGWASNSGGVTRDNFAFHQGIVADTVYKDSLLTSGGNGS